MDDVQQIRRRRQTGPHEDSTSPVSRKTNSNSGINIPAIYLPANTRLKKTPSPNTAQNTSETVEQSPATVPATDPVESETGSSSTETDPQVSNPETKTPASAEAQDKSPVSSDSEGGTGGDSQGEADGSKTEESPEAGAEQKKSDEEGEDSGGIVYLSETATSAKARGSGSSKMELPEIPPLELPRLNNIRTPFIPPPPKPAIERSSEIIEKTGSPPELHRAQIRQAVERVADVARASQRKIVWRINLLAKDTRASFDVIASEISRHIRSAIGAINNSITQAKSQIKDVVDGIEKHFKKNKALVGAELRKSQKERSKEVVDTLLTGNTELKKAHEDLQKEFKPYLDSAKTNMAKIGTDGVIVPVKGPPAASGGGAKAPPAAPEKNAGKAKKRKNMLAIQKDVDSKYASLNSDAIGRYVTHRSEPVATRMYKGTQRQLTSRFQKYAKDLDSYKNSFSLNALQLLTPTISATKKDTPEHKKNSDTEHKDEIKVAREGSKYNLGLIHTKQKQAGDFLDKELGPKLIEGLKKMEAKGVKTFRHQGKSTACMLNNTAAPMAMAYPDIMARVGNMLPKNKFLDARKYLPSINSARKSAFELPDSQMKPLHERVAVTLEQAQAGKRKQVEAIGKSVDKGMQAVSDVAIKTSFDMDSFAFQATGKMRQGGLESITGAQDYALRIANDLLSTKDNAKGQLNALFGSYVSNFNKNLTDAGGNYFDAVDSFSKRLFSVDDGVFEKIKKENGDKLNSKSKVLHDNLTHADEDVTTSLVIVNVLTLGATTGVTLGYLAYKDADESDVFTALGDLDWPGQAALEEFFNTETTYGNLRSRINESMDSDDAKSAINMLSSNAEDRAKGRNDAIEASLSWTDFGISDEARQALLAGTSKEEREASDPAQLKRIGEEIRSSWTLTDTEIRMQAGYLEGNLDAVLAARMEQNMRKARQDGDSNIQQSVQSIDQMARAEMSRTQSSIYLQPGDVQNLIDGSMKEFAANRPGEKRKAGDIDVSEARQTFVDYATADRYIHHGHEAPPTPIPVDQFVKDYVEEVVTNGFYVSTKKDGEEVWETNRDAQAAAQAYQVHRAETSYSGPSESNVTAFNSAFRNPTLQRLQLQVDEARRKGEKVNPDLLNRLQRERAKHEQQMALVATRLVPQGEKGPEPGQATEWMAQRATMAFAGENAVPKGTRQEPGMARFSTELIRNGRASVAAGVSVATEGVGTNEDLLRSIYSGRTRAEIQTAETEWKERYGQDLNEYLGIKEREWDALDYAVLAISPVAGLGLLAYRGGETSGDLAMELEILAKGEPETDQDRIEIAMLRAEQQQRRGTGFLGQLTMSDTPENHQMNNRRQELARMLLDQAMINQGSRTANDGQKLPGINGVFLPDGRVNPVVAALAFSKPKGSSKSQFEGNRSSLMESMHHLEWAGKRYQAEQSRQEALMLGGITILAIAATVILMAFGVGFLLAGMLVALGSGILTMAVKQGMRGERYGWEEAATDAAMTAIEVAAAGAGGALAGGFGTAGKLGSVVTAFNKLGPVAGPMAREAIVGAVSSAAQITLQDGTFSDGPGKAFERIMGAGFKGAAVGTVSAGLSESATKGLNTRLAAGLDGSDVGRVANLGRNMGPNARAMLTEVVSEGVGSVAGEGVAILIEVSKGEFRGGLDDALRRIGNTGLKDMVSAAGRTAATSNNKRRYGDLLAEAHTKETLTDSDLKALRMAGAAAGEPFESLDRVRARVDDGKHVLNALPAELRDQVSPLDADNLRTLADMLGKAELGSSSKERQKLLQDIADKAPQIDMLKLVKTLDEANALRQATIDKQQDMESLEHQQQVRSQLLGNLDPEVADRLNKMSVDGIDKLTEVEIRLAADMIQSGRFNSDKADALLSKARSRDSEVDGFSFLRNLQSAVEAVGIARQARIEMQIERRKFVMNHVPEEARLIFAGMSEEGVAKVKDLLESDDSASPKQREELFRMARDVDPELTRDNFLRFLEKASANVTHEKQAQLKLRQEERLQRMGNIPEHLRSTLSVMPDDALILLRIAQLRGELSPAERQFIIDSALTAKPDLDVESFAKALMQASESKPQLTLSDDEEKKLREELLSAIPAEQQHLMDDVPIIMMRGKEFEAFTRSQTGQAVTLILHGRPVIVMREGASPDVLREEGIHVLQSKDPDWAERIGALDEAHLRDWDNLSLEQQLILYSNKVDLEIDAQQRVIRSLENEIANADSPQTTQHLQIQLEQAMASLQNLGRRRAEVDSIDQFELNNIKAGFSERPQWLDQPARLFNKLAEATRGETEPISKEQEAEERKLIAGLMLGDLDEGKAQAFREIADQIDLQNLHYLAGAASTGEVFQGMLSRLNSTGDLPGYSRQLANAFAIMSGDQRARLAQHFSTTHIKHLKVFVEGMTDLSSRVDSDYQFQRLLEMSFGASKSDSDKMSMKNLEMLLRVTEQVDRVHAEQLIMLSDGLTDSRKLFEAVDKVDDPKSFMEKLVVVADAIDTRYLDDTLGWLLKRPVGEIVEMTRQLHQLRQNTPITETFRDMLDMIRLSKSGKMELLRQLVDLTGLLDVHGRKALNELLAKVNKSDHAVMIESLVIFQDITLKQYENSLDVGDRRSLLNLMMEMAATRTQWLVFTQHFTDFFSTLHGLPKTDQNKIAIQKILDYVLKPLDTNGGTQADRRELILHLAADITAAVKALSEPVTPGSSQRELRSPDERERIIQRQVTNLKGAEGRLAGKDAWLAHLTNEADTWKTKKNDPNSKHFADLVDSVKKGWDDGEKGAMLELQGWFDKLARINNLDPKSTDPAEIKQLEKLLEQVLSQGFKGGRNEDIKKRSRFDDLKRAIREMTVEASLANDPAHAAEKQLRREKALARMGISEDDLKGRKDARNIDEHINTLVERQLVYERMIEIAKEVKGSTAGMQQNITEVRGELALTVHMLKKNPDMLLVMPFGKGTGFDQVWVRTSDGTLDGDFVEVVIGEAKGPGAKLGNPAKGPQMSREWVVATLREMVASSNKATRDLAKKLIEATTLPAGGTPPPYRGIVVEAREVDAGPPPVFESKDITASDRGSSGYDFSGIDLPDPKLIQ